LRNLWTEWLDMSEMLPILLVPGLACTARLFAHQIPALWTLGPVTVANHTASDTIAGVGAAILERAPPRFHLAGLSMGGYICYELIRQAPDRVVKLALLDTAARADTPEQTERRRKLIALAEAGRLMEVNDVLWPVLVHERHEGDGRLRAVADEMLAETGAEAFIRQVKALISRIDSRPTLPTIRSPSIVLVGDSDRITPPAAGKEIADAIPGARYEIVPASGHLSTLEQPEIVTRLLTEWFAGDSRS
jgi:pimeloyl-ACP methyl ester carboxylesterase